MLKQYSAISVPGGAAWTRKQFDEVTDWVKRPQIGMQGLVYIRYNEDGTIRSSVDKFYSEERLKSLAAFTKAEKGDAILILAGREEKTRKAISDLRLELGERLGFAEKRRIQIAMGHRFPSI